MFVAAIVMAAGESSRMGGQKLLLPFGGSTIVEKVARDVAGSGVGETIVVLGSRAEEIKPKMTGLPVRIVHNTHYREGMSTSVIAGIEAVSPQADAVMFVLADKPFIDSLLINRILDEYRRGGKDIVVPVHRGRRGHPVIISLKYREEMLSLKGDIGARDIIARHGDDVYEVSVDSAGIYIDIDTEDDYLSLT